MHTDENAFQRILSLNGWAIAVLIAGFSFILMATASQSDSAIMDELAHIPAGYGYVSQLDYRLNPEHPPLLKALAAFPLLFEDVSFPTQSSAWQTDINGQWEMGTEFLYQSGNDADRIVRIARVAPMLLTVLLILLIYAWSKELLGKFWALVPTFLFALSPTVLAHGHYVTTDVAAAFGIVFAAYFFIKFLLVPSRRHLFYAGLALGVAELLKFSAVLLVPYFFLLIAVFYAASVARDWQKTNTGPASPAGGRFRRFGIRAFRYLWSTILIFVIGYALVVYPIYFLFTVHYPIQKQVSDTESILTSFAGGPTQTGRICKPVRCLADLDVWMAKNPITRPAGEYLLGVLMVLQRSAGGNTNYFLGEVSAAGSHSYFPIVYFLKEPLPVLALVLLGLIIGIANMVKARKTKSSRFLDYLGTNFPEFAMIAFVILYWAWSINSPLNIGFRHLLPTLPFIYILTASALKKWATLKMPAAPEKSFFRMAVSWLKTAFTYSLKHILILALLVWLFTETVFAAPYFLSYFNEFGGGPWNGYRYVTDSNYDWGQDMLRLKQFVADHPEIDKIAVDYFGGGNPKYYLGNTAEGWQSSRGNPADTGIHWLAVSINTLESAIQPTVAGQQRNPQDEYRWLTELRPPTSPKLQRGELKLGLGAVPEPDYKAGTSIFIYKL